MCRSVAIAAVVLLLCPTLGRADGGPVDPTNWWWRWNWDLLVLVGLGTLAWIYSRGLVRCWRKSGTTTTVRRWQAVLFFHGLLAILVALISPLDALSNELLSMHMVQHMLLATVAAPLIVLGAPTFVIAWGLPELKQGSTARLFTFLFRLPQEPILWHPVFLLVLFAGTLWVWHHPVPYQAALGDPLVHDAQHISLFVVSCLFWRGCLDTLSSRRLHPTKAIAYLFATSVHASALGVFLTLAPQVWYSHYASRTMSWGVTPLEDQQMAGLIMWIPSCLCYPAVAAILFGKWLAESTTANQQNNQYHTDILREPGVWSHR